ncbi:MAG: LemA family protein [Clostridium sp.]
MGILRMLLLLAILLCGAMYTAFKQPILKMQDIIKDLCSGLKMREEVMSGLLNIVKSVSDEEYVYLNNKLSIYDELHKITNDRDKVDFDEQMDDIVVSFLTIEDRQPLLMENFKYIELMLQYKGLETRIINIRFKYNGFVRKYNIRRESALSKFFLKIYKFKEEKEIYISEPIKDILTRVQTDCEEVACEG